MQSLVSKVEASLNILHTTNSCVYCSDITKLFGHVSNSRNFYDALDILADEDVTASLPIRAALVINKGTGMPGAGFFAFARKKGLLTHTDDRKFWRTELKKLTKNTHINMPI
jgi:hypothetical protein